MSVQLTSNQRKLLNQLKFEAKNPKYVKERQKLEQTKQNQALHGLENHIVNNKVKTYFQQEVYKLLKPIVFENKFGKKIYKRKETINKIYNLIEGILEYGTSQEIFEIFELISFIEHSEEERKARNKKRKHDFDPKKNGHDIARKFITDLVDLFYFIFSERKQLFY
jgi:hypothetical protein